MLEREAFTSKVVILLGSSNASNNTWWQSGSSSYWWLAAKTGSGIQGDACMHIKQKISIATPLWMPTPRHKDSPCSFLQGLQWSLFWARCSLQEIPGRLGGNWQRHLWVRNVWWCGLPVHLSREHMHRFVCHLSVGSALVPPWWLQRTSELAILFLRAVHRKQSMYSRSGSSNARSRWLQRRKSYGRHCFVVLVYLELWFTGPSAVQALQHDLKLI